MHLTRSQQKQRFLELQQKTAIKRARLLVMKRLATEYLSSNVNGKFNYDTFCKQTNNVYPWLKKEVLRWHIRRQQEINNNKITLEKSTSPSTEEGKATKTYKVCLHIQ